MAAAASHAPARRASAEASDRDGNVTDAMHDVFIIDCSCNLHLSVNINWLRATWMRAMGGFSVFETRVSCVPAFQTLFRQTCFKLVSSAFQISKSSLLADLSNVESCTVSCVSR